MKETNDDFEFQMLEVSAVDNPKRWGLVSAFVVDHPQGGCARATYIRATIGYISSVLMLVGTDSFWGKVVTAIYKWAPGLIGAKVLMCTQCHQVVFISKLVSSIYLPIAAFLGLSKVKIIVCPYDTFNIPHDKRDEFFSPGG